MNTFFIKKYYYGDIPNESAGGNESKIHIRYRLKAWRLAALGNFYPQQTGTRSQTCG
jgi:hypothetical protein